MTCGARWTFLGALPLQKCNTIRNRLLWHTMRRPDVITAELPSLDQVVERRQTAAYLYGRVLWAWSES